MKKQDPHKLTFDEALSLIEIHMEGKKKRTHSFEGGLGLMGCDMDLTTVKKQMKDSDDIRLSGPNMHRMGHGFGYYREGRGYLFIKTDMTKVKEVIKKRKIKDII